MVAHSCKSILKNDLKKKKKKHYHTERMHHLVRIQLKMVINICILSSIK